MEHPADTPHWNDLRQSRLLAELDEAIVQVELILRGQLTVLPEHLNELGVTIGTACHLLVAADEDRPAGRATLSFTCPLCGAAPGTPCTANYGRGDRTVYPHLQRVKLARLGQDVSLRTEQKRRYQRQRLESAWINQLAELDQLASLVDNTPPAARRDRLISIAKEVLK